MAILVTFLSAKSSFIADCVIPPGKPAASPAPGALSPSTGTKFTKSNTRPKLTVKASLR